MAKMTGTVLKSQLTCSAMSSLARNAQPLIENSMLGRLSSSFNIVHRPIGNFDDALVDDILIGLNAEFDLLELFR